MNSKKSQQAKSRSGKIVVAFCLAVIMTFIFAIVCIISSDTTAEAARMTTEEEMSTQEEAGNPIDEPNQEIDEGVNLPNDIEQSDNEWVVAYYKYLSQKQYLSSDQKYGKEVEIKALLFDMDWDGIPELIMKTGYKKDEQDSTGIAYAYTYSNGAMTYIGQISSHPYAYYNETENPNGLYGYLFGYSFECELVKYKKEGLSISNHLYEGIQVQSVKPVYEELCFRPINVLKKQLNAYGQASNISSNPASSVIELEKLLSGLGWAEMARGGDYDYTYNGLENSEHFEFWPMFNDNFINPNKYVAGTKLYDSSAQDPRRKKYCYNFNGEKLDWVMRNVFNKNDDYINSLHSSETHGFYYQDGDYYASGVGVGGGYDAYITKIENLGKAYQIYYTEVDIPDGGDDIEYIPMYALAAYRNIDGKSFWSIYYTSKSPLNEKYNALAPSLPASTQYSNEWIDGKWYNEDGSQTYEGTLSWKSNSVGWWVEDSSGWYPTDKWQKIDGYWYYFKPDGYIACGEYYGGYWFNDDGSWDDKYELSWKGNSTGWWVEDKSGWYPSSQWLKIDGSWYYFGSDGYMVTSQYVDGYWINENGVSE